MIRTLKASIAAIVALGGLLASGAALGAASPWWENEHGAVRLIAASNAVGDGLTLKLGLHFRMKDGWKIYWRSPGDAGFPPRADWAGSANFAEARMSWPVPERFSVLDLETLGYKNEVVLPLTVDLFEPGKPVRLKANISYLTCEEICVPYATELALELPAGPETSSVEEGLIERFAALVPKSGEAGPLRVASASAVGGGPTRAIEVAIEADAPLSRPDIYVEGPEGWAFKAPAYQIDGEGKSAIARVAAFAPPKVTDSLAGSRVTLTVVDGGRAIEHSIVLDAAVTRFPAAGGDTADRSLVVILLLAVLGGLILNLMPCVLPVLSLKLLSAVSHGGGDRGAVRAGFLASASGILVSFLALGTGAVALRLGGESAGWGIQFQQPIFLVAMALIVALFAANLFGLFEINLPGSVSDLAVRAGDSGSGHGHEQSLRSHFLTGAFATLLATPCSAPFLGTAVGFALSRGIFEIYAVFAALGVGLALPYLAVAAFPGLATRMPKPGPWMVTLRRGLAIILLGTAIWLLTVLAVQIGLTRTVGIGVALAVLLLGLAIARAGGARVRAGRALSGLAAICALAVALWPGAGPSGGTAFAAHWQSFDRQAIAREVAAGKVVFVDVTADWCITCQVNKALVLKNEPVLGRLQSEDVSAMVADWTRPDEAITEYLKSHGRYGIPFNAVYGPGLPDGEPLPEILTEKIVMDALARAAGRGPTSTAGR